MCFKILNSIYRLFPSHFNFVSKADVIHEAVEQGKITHFNQPALNVSIRTVKKRSIGKDGMFGYASMNPDIQSDPTEAAAFAYYGAIRFKKEKTTSGSGQSIMV